MNKILADMNFLAYLRLHIFTVAVASSLSLLCAATGVAASANSAAPDADRVAHKAVQVARSAVLPAQLPQVDARPVRSKLNPAANEHSDLQPLQVIYEDGELTIIAENVSLSEVFSEVRTVMGADIDIPASAAGERIWVRFGPGPARNILRDLLDGTDFDYVIQGSDTDQGGVRSVSLVARGKTPELAGASSQISPAANRHFQATPEIIESDNVAIPETEPVSDPVPPVSVSSSLDSGRAERQASGLPSTAPLVGSPDHMARQLQNLYQQRRQMQMHQNQKSSVPN